VKRSIDLLAKCDGMARQGKTLAFKYYLREEKEPWR